MLEMVVC